MARRQRLIRVAIVVAAVLALAGLAYAGAQPAFLPWAVPEVPAEAQAAAGAVLTAAGYAPLAPPAWAGSKTAWQQRPARYRVFFLAAPAGEPDVFQADVSIDADGRLAPAPLIKVLTDTPAGAETAPLLAGNWLAYATRVGNRYQSITCVSLADLGRPRVFVFTQPQDQVTLAWHPGAPGSRLAIAVTGATGRTSLALDPATPGLEPDDGTLIYVPVQQGEQAWLPNLVSRVRELPGVGPEKIAFLENVFFTAEDRITQWLHGRSGAARAPAPTAAVDAPPAAEPALAAAPAAPLPAGSGSPAPCLGVCGDATAPRNAAAPAAPNSPVTTTLSATITRTLPGPAAGSAAAQPTTAPAVSPTATEPAPPPTPVIGKPLADGILRQAPVYPDGQRPYAEVELIDIDPALLQIKMIAGTAEPRSTTGLVGTGEIPAAERGALVAAFNGGFAAMHGAFGLMIDRKVYLPARSGIATLAVYEDGSLRMGTWGKDLAETSDMVSYRQNCPPLIENGTITAETGKLTLWGLSVANEVYLYRSGLGLTADGQLVYAAGRHLSAYTLARALQLAGAVYAMQLDVDEFHVAFITYDVQPASAGGQETVTGRKLRDDMRGFDGLFLRPFQLDFFYLLRRPKPLAHAVRTPGGAPAVASEHASVADLPGRLAFASNRDGNWELYLQQPGRPDTVRRLTDDPADDLYPAWSPDGSRLAFSSRRGGNSDIYTLDLAGLGVRPVTRLLSEEWAPAWAPDGAHLVFQSDRNGQSDIYMSKPDGRDEVRLTPQQGNHEAPHWSPDSTEIVFDSDLDVAEAVHASINLYVMPVRQGTKDVGGATPRRIFDHGESPAWSPDGRRIAFTSLRGGRWQVLLIGVDGSGYRQLTNGPFDARYPTWSPDGRWLAFAGNRGGRWEIYAIPVGGASQPGASYPLQITASPADSSYPAWGP